MEKEKDTSMMEIYVAFLRALYAAYQNAHWTAKSYEEHLLFERLYNSVASNVDQAAEKTVGKFSSDLNFATQISLIARIIGKYSASKTDVKSLIDFEKEFLKYSEELFEHMKNNKDLSLGADDLIMSISNDHETNIYLLNQALTKS